VLRSYSQQMQNVLRYDPHLRKRRREEARVRMQRNFDYIEYVFAEFGHGWRAYHYAICSVRVMKTAPSNQSLKGLRLICAIARLRSITNFSRTLVALWPEPIISHRRFLRESTVVAGHGCERTPHPNIGQMIKFPTKRRALNRSNKYGAVCCPEYFSNMCHAAGRLPSRLRSSGPEAVHVSPRFPL
jgi:hypothetical protein